MPDPERSQELSDLEALLNSKELAAVLDAILGTPPSGAVIARAPDGKILRMSDYAAKLLGRSRSELEGHAPEARLTAYDASGRRLANHERPVARAMGGETVTDFEIWFETPQGERIPCIVKAAPIRNWRGELIGAIASIADLRLYKAAEQSLQEAHVQKEAATAHGEALYRELIHRVKNHLQVMTSLLTLEARDPALSGKDLGDQMKGRLQTLAAVYRGMDRADAGERIEARTFVEEVCGPYASDAVSVEVAVEPPDLTLTSEQAGPVGMLMNEAVRNSSEHLAHGRGGRVKVSLRRLDSGRLRLEAAETGAELGSSAPGASEAGTTEAGPASRQLELMRMFAKQLRGELELSERAPGAAVIAAEFPTPAS